MVAVGLTHVGEPPSDVRLVRLGGRDGPKGGPGTVTAVGAHRGLQTSRSLSPWDGRLKDPVRTVSFTCPKEF